MECHPKATPQMANYKVHTEFNREQNPFGYYFQVFFIALTGGTLLSAYVGPQGVFDGGFDVLQGYSRL